MSSREEIWEVMAEDIGRGPSESRGAEAALAWLREKHLHCLRERHARWRRSPRNREAKRRWMVDYRKRLKAGRKP